MPKKIELPKVTLLYDDREKKPWPFRATGQIGAIEKKRLKTGDYQIKEYEDLICIERKSSVSEIYTNITKGRKNFYKELDRMKEFKNNAIICEFPMSRVFDDKSYYHCGNIKGWAAANNVLSNICKITQVYKIPIFFTDNRLNAMNLTRRMIYYALKVKFSTSI